MAKDAATNNMHLYNPQLYNILRSNPYKTRQLEFKDGIIVDHIKIDSYFRQNGYLPETKYSAPRLGQIVGIKERKLFSGIALFVIPV